jgi:serine O-acetyltransferase
MICKSFRDCFCLDLKLKYPSITPWKVFCMFFSESRVLAVVLMRISQYLVHKKGLWRFAPFVKRLNEILTGFECHLSATISEGLFLAHTQNLVIGEGVVVGQNVTLYNGVTLGAGSRGNAGDKERYPIIGKRVTIYTGAKVLGFIHLGDDSIVGANSVVLKDIPTGCIAVGVPAKILTPK